MSFSFGSSGGFGGFGSSATFGKPAPKQNEAYVFDEEEYQHVREKILEIIKKHIPQVNEYEVESVIRTIYEHRSRCNFEIQQKEKADKNPPSTTSGLNSFQLPAPPSITPTEQ